ncbi:MAG: hypothetical protein NTV05_04710 [Acidobacteria bacterium]|nr:hypothetical protein [Acidobacteriota bacterium]
MTIVRSAATLLVGIAVLGPPVAAQKGSASADVVRAAAEYLAAYAPRISGVSLEEEYTMLEVPGGRLANTRRITSDVVLLNLAGKVIALRDAFAIDSNPLRKREPRITALLAKPTSAAWGQAQAYAAESFRHLQAELILSANEPTLALQLIAPENQSRVSYKIDGRKRLDGVEVVGLRFQEPKTKNPSYIIKTPGNAEASGRLWIDPLTGRIHQTELSLQSPSESARIAVTYAFNPALDLWLPASMSDTYEMTERTAGLQNMGAGGFNSRMSFDCRATYSNPRLTPIDLAVPK